MARRILPHTTAALLTSTVLATGEVVVDDTYRVIRIGDGSTAGGLLIGGKAPVYVTSPPWNAKGDGVTNDSAAIQACIDANRGGTIILDAGKIFLAAGIALSGATYNGTTIVIQGTFKLAPSGGAANWDTGPGSQVWAGITLYNTRNVTVDAPGMLDGNRAAQANSQQHHLINLRGAKWCRFPRLYAREIRGDVLVCSTSSNVNTYTDAEQTTNLSIGTVIVENTADDGRNAVSIISGDDVTIDTIISKKVGGIINGERMPGGLDLEADGGHHRIRRFRCSKLIVETIGTSGFAAIGASKSGNEALRDWNCEDIEVTSMSITHTGDAIGGPIIKRVRDIRVYGVGSRTGARSSFFEFDFCDKVVADISISGNIANGLTLGFTNYVNDFDITVLCDNHASAGILAVGVNRGTLRGRITGGQGAGSFGIQVAAAGRSGLVQDSVIYSVDLPPDGNSTFQFYTGAGITFNNCAVANCTIAGGQTAFGLNSYLPIRNVQGVNWKDVQPSIGTFSKGTIINNTNPTIVTGRVLTGWLRLTDGSAHVAGTDWTPLYSNVAAS